MDRAHLQVTLERHIPAAALAYCMQLWDRNPFDFKVRKKRVSKVGDFTCRHGKNPLITINSDSHPYVFLMTYIHEVAHLIVHKSHGWNREAHGPEWKAVFRQLLQPLLTNEVYPVGLLTVLEAHMVNPKASSFSDPELTKAFRDHDSNFKQATLLSQLPQGSIFELHGRWFRKGQLKRTRVLCHELKTKRNYLVSADSPVGSVQLSFL
jgi:SprT protein